MENKKFWLGMLVTVLVFGMTVVGCDDGSTDNNVPKTVKYESKDASGNTYILTVTENTGRAVYSAETGDSYELKIVYLSGVIKISIGTVHSVTGGNLTLTPSNATVSFSVIFTGGNMTGLSGTITLNDGETVSAPTDDLTPAGNDNDPSETILGKWIYTKNIQVYQGDMSFEYFENGQVVYKFTVLSSDEPPVIETMTGVYSFKNGLIELIFDDNAQSYEFELLDDVLTIKKMMQEFTDTGDIIFHDVIFEREK